MNKDFKTNLPYKPAVLRDRNGDLKKTWYIEFYAWHDASNNLVRKRVSVSMDYRDAKSRKAEGIRIVGEINKLLQKGFHFTAEPIPDLSENPAQKKELLKLMQSILDITQNTIAPKTVITYQGAINKLRDYAGEKILYLEDFGNKESVNFRDHLIIVTKNSARTANNTIQHLLSIFSKLQERTGIEKNPFKIKSLREPATFKNIAFTDEDRELVEKHLLEREPGVYLFTRLMYFGFIRPGEILKLQFGHVNMNDAYITVHGLISKNGKTETAQIIPALEKELKNRMTFQRPDHFLFSTGMTPGKFPLSKQVPFRRHEKILKDLGLLEKGYTLYSWKHTGAVNAYRSGVGIKELQSMLRHSSIQITDIYLKSLGLRTDPNLKNYNW